MTTNHLRRAILAGLVLLLLPGLALASETETADDADAALRTVPAVKVCMVNDQLFERDQIPVEVDGKTYYGCCEMCKERLAKDREIRFSADPVTGNVVDKAIAVMAADRSGAILYFESEETMQQYLAQLEGEDEPSDG